MYHDELLVGDVRLVMLVPSFFPKAHVAFDWARVQGSRVSVVFVLRGTMQVSRESLRVCVHDERIAAWVVVHHNCLKASGSASLEQRRRPDGAAAVNNLQAVSAILAALLFGLMLLLC